MMQLSSSPAPHVIGNAEICWRMRDMLLSLTPLVVAAASFHGAAWLGKLAVALVLSAAMQVLCCLPFGRRVGLGDLSFAVSGAMCALLLPAAAPVWGVALAAILAQVMRAAFGGLGRNWCNPALFGTLVVYLTGSAGEGAWAALTQTGVLSPTARFLGCATTGPAITTALLLVALGWLYLLIRGLARPAFSLSFLLALALVQLPFGVPLTQTGLFGVATPLALFCGSDSVTTPIRRRAQLLFGLILGLAVGVGRLTLRLDLSAVAILLCGPVCRWLDA